MVAVAMPGFVAFATDRTFLEGRHSQGIYGSGDFGAGSQLAELT